MTEPIRETGPALHLGEKLGDAQTRHQAIEPPRDVFAFGGFVLADRADRQPLGGDGRLREVAGGRDRIDFPEPGV